MDRRDIPPEDRYGGGQSYRPGNTRIRTPPPPRRDRDTYNARSPARRPYDSRGPPRGGRSRSPPAREPFRRRSPSPRERFGVPRGGDSYRSARPRSPLRRDDGPRDDLFRRDVGRDFRDERGSRAGRDFDGRASPPRFRDRSPGRVSPQFRDRRTSPGLRRDRTPPRRYDDYPVSRPQSPPRRKPSPRGSEWDFPSRPRSPGMQQSRAPSDRQRPRSPSPRGHRTFRDLDGKGRESGATSRRSSPPVHTSRLALVQDAEEPRSGRPSPRGYGIDNTVKPAARSPESRIRNTSPPKDKDGDYVLNDAPALRNPERPGETSLPPSGPSAARPPPAGPGAPVSSRPFVAPPAGPRGDNIAPRAGYTGRGRGGYASTFTTPGRTSITTTFRGDRGGPPAFSRAPTNDREPIDSTPRSFDRPLASRTSSTTTPRFDGPSQIVYEPPREPRASLSTAQSDSYRRYPSGPNAAPSGPASDRLKDARPMNDIVHPALRNLPEIVPNGKKIPPVADHSRLNKLEDETERLRRSIQEKEARKRKNLREWDRLVREGESAAYRSEIAETSVRAFDGEGERVGSAF